MTCGCQTIKGLFSKDPWNMFFLGGREVTVKGHN